MSILRVLGVILHRGLKAVLQLGLRCGFYCLSLCVLCRWVSVVLAAQTIARRCFSRKADGKPGKDLLYTQGSMVKITDPSVRKISGHNKIIVNWQ